MPHITATVQGSHHHHIARNTLERLVEPELDQTLVCGALVVRNGEHFRISIGAESTEELEGLSRVAEGRCVCGAALSLGHLLHHCRRCGRQFR